MSLTLCVCLKEGKKASFSLPPKLVLLFLFPMVEVLLKVLEFGRSICTAFRKWGEDFVTQAGKSPGFVEIGKAYCTCMLCGFPQSSLLVFIP